MIRTLTLTTVALALAGGALAESDFELNKNYACVIEYEARQSIEPEDANYIPSPVEAEQKSFGFELIDCSVLNKERSKTDCRDETMMHRAFLKFGDSRRLFTGGPDVRMGGGWGSLMIDGLTIYRTEMDRLIDGPHFVTFSKAVCFEVD